MRRGRRSCGQRRARRGHRRAGRGHAPAAGGTAQAAPQPLPPPLAVQPGRRTRDLAPYTPHSPGRRLRHRRRCPRTARARRLLGAPEGRARESSGHGCPNMEPVPRGLARAALRAAGPGARRARPAFPSASASRLLGLR